MAAPTLVRPAAAQGYPARNVRVIVPFAPGGITDVLARLIAEKWSEQLGRQFYVENVTGGSGNIGMGQAAKAAPDGYTILTAFVSYAVNPALFAKVPYDPVRDFEPISLLGRAPIVPYVNPAFPPTNVKELVALAKALRTVRLEAIVIVNLASMLNRAPVTIQDIDLLLRDTGLNRRKLARFAEAIGGASDSALHDRW